MSPTWNPEDFMDRKDPIEKSSMKPKRKWQFLEHIVRKRDLEHMSLTRITDRRRRRGRFRPTFLDSLPDVIPEKRKKIKQLLLLFICIIMFIIIFYHHHHYYYDYMIRSIIGRRLFGGPFGLLGF